MRICLIFLLSIFVSAAFAQKPAEVLATSSEAKFTVESLSPEAQKLYANRDKMIAETRSQLAAEMAAEVALELEAKATGKTVEKLLEEAQAKAAQPTDAEIKAVYDGNRETFAGRPLDEVKPAIVNYLRSESSKKAGRRYIESLGQKYKVTTVKDVNAFGLKQNDVLFTAGGRSVTFGEFEQKYRAQIADTQADIYDEIYSDLESAIFSSLVEAEAKARGTDVSELIAAEVTDKMREYTEFERAELQRALLKKLSAKNTVNILLKEPPAVVQNVSVDDDPAVGPATAPVTVVMFTDFQCPACAQTHPVLKRVLAEFGSSVRLVIRDLPLEQIHPDAFMAARAANAARAQGKFVEYTEKLYSHQDALDKASLIRYASELGLNVNKFELDFNDEKTAAEIRKDIADGVSYGASRTPTIFVNGIKVRRLSADAFRTAISRALGK